MNLLISFRSEILKTKRTAIFYLTFIAAGFIPFIFLLNVSLDGVTEENGKEGFNSLFKLGSEMLGFAIFPLFVVLVCTMLPQIEYRNNAWKQVYASPQPVLNVFIARFLHVHLMILMFIVLFNLFMFMVAIAIHFMIPSVNFLGVPVKWIEWLSKNAIMYVAGLSISAIQFWFGLRFRNFIIPIAVGFALWLTGTVMVMEFGSRYAYFFPYSYLPYSLFPKYKHLMPTVMWNSLGYMALFLAIGFIDFRRGKK